MNANDALSKFAAMAWSKIIFIAALAAALFYFVGVDKGVTEQEFATAETNRKNAETTLRKTKEAVADLKKFRAQIDDMNTQFTQMTAYMTAAPNFSDFVLSIQQLAGKSGAIVRSVTPSNKVEHIDFYDTSHVDLVLEGRYSQLLGFLSDISKMRRLVTVEDLELGQSSGGDVKNGLISFKTTLVGYRYAPPAPVAPGGAAPANPGDPAAGAPNAQ